MCFLFRIKLNKDSDNVLFENESIKIVEELYMSFDSYSGYDRRLKAYKKLWGVFLYTMDEKLITFESDEKDFVKKYPELNPWFVEKTLKRHQ